MKKNLLHNNTPYKKHFCSSECKKLSSDLRCKSEVTCKVCGKLFKKKKCDIKKTINNFCSHSCNGTYNNTHKLVGTRRSKLEKWLEETLVAKFPQTDFTFNQKSIINSELDIYIPSMKLAFELNGIFHYEPIFGEEKLSQTQNNDHRKFQACAERGISLCIIDISGQKYFKESTSQKYLDIISDIINQKMAGS